VEGCEARVREKGETWCSQHVAKKGWKKGKRIKPLPEIKPEKRNTSMFWSRIGRPERKKNERVRVLPRRVAGMGRRNRGDPGKLLELGAKKRGAYRDRDWTSL